MTQDNVFGFLVQNRIRGVTTMVPELRDGSVPVELIEKLPEKLSQNTEGCTGCGQAGCHTIGCPAGNNMPEINPLYELALSFEQAGNTAVAKEYYKLGFDKSWETNPFGLWTGRLCPSSQLCEGGCVYVGDPIDSRGIEYLLHKMAWNEGWVPNLAPTQDLDRDVAFVGSGPAAIAGAEYAIRQGFNVTMFERSSMAGGLLTFGIPEHKRMYTEDVLPYITRLQDAGVAIHTNTVVGARAVIGKTHVTVLDLARQFDAVVFATGVTKPHNPLVGIEGGEHAKPAIDFLTYNSMKEQVLLGFGDDQMDRRIAAYEREGFNMEGKRVLVIGGSDTAADGCNVSAMRQGAESVTHIYRSSESQMRMDSKEKKTALEAGVKFSYEITVKKISKKSGGVFTVTLSDETQIEVDEILTATGFSPEDFSNNFGINFPLTDKGLFQVYDPIMVKGSEIIGNARAVAGSLGFFRHEGISTYFGAIGDATGGGLVVESIAGARDFIGSGKMRKAIHEGRSNLNYREFGMAA